MYRHTGLATGLALLASLAFACSSTTNIVNNTVVDSDAGGAGAGHDGAPPGTSGGDGGAGGGDDGASTGTGDDGGGGDAAADAGPSATLQGVPWQAAMASGFRTKYFDGTYYTDAVGVMISDQVFTCGSVSGSHGPKGVHFVRMGAGYSGGGATNPIPDGGVPVLTPGTYRLSSSSQPYASLYLEQINFTCGLQSEEPATAGSITFATITDAGVTGSFAVTFGDGGSPLSGTFDTTFCDPSDNDAGACQ